MNQSLTELERIVVPVGEFSGVPLGVMHPDDIQSVVETLTVVQSFRLSSLPGDDFYHLEDKLDLFLGQARRYLALKKKERRNHEGEDLG